MNSDSRKDVETIAALRSRHRIEMDRAIGAADMAYVPSHMGAD